jgi:hypothetical protein
MVEGIAHFANKNTNTAINAIFDDMCVDLGLNKSEFVAAVAKQDSAPAAEDGGQARVVMNDIIRRAGEVDVDIDDIFDGAVEER